MKHFFIGIDLGGTRVKIGLVYNSTVIAQKIAPAHSATGLLTYLPLLQQEINTMITEQAPPDAVLRGMGLAFPGIVDPAAKKILSTNKKYDDAIALDLDKWVQDTWGVPFMIDNDARMATVGEWKQGAGKGCNNLVMMTIGTGIGTSAIIEGKLLRGKHFQAGVLGGHVSIDYKGERCICGNTGCVEIYGGTWNLKTFITQHTLYNNSILQHAEVFDFYTVFDAARKGDQLAILVQQQCMDAWAAGIVSLIHAYDPEVIVLGGGVLKSADLILPYIREKVQQQAWSPWGTAAITPSQLADTAAIAGIVHCIQENI